MSGSYIIPDFLHETRLFSMTIDFLGLLDSPITVCFASKCLSETFPSHPNCDLVPPDKKSSPCTTTLIPRSLQQNEHGLAVPRAKPCSVRTLAYASSQFAAASRVPYSDTLNLPYSGYSDRPISDGSSTYFFLVWSMKVCTADVGVHHGDLIIGSMLSPTKPRLRVSLCRRHQ